jgi:prophage regulatory protein
MNATNDYKLYPTPDTLLCLSDVLTLIKVSESTWWAGIAAGKFPRPVKCGRRSFWPESTIAEFIESLKKDLTAISENEDDPKIKLSIDKKPCNGEMDQ